MTSLTIAVILTELGLSVTTRSLSVVEASGQGLRVRAERVRPHAAWSVEIHWDGAIGKGSLYAASVPELEVGVRAAMPLPPAEAR